MEKFQHKPIPAKFPGVFIHTSRVEEEFDKDEFMKLFKYDVSLPLEKSVKQPELLEFTVIKLTMITIGQEKTKKRKFDVDDVYSLPPPSDIEYVLPNRHYFTEFIKDKLAQFKPNLSQRCEDLNDTVLVSLPHQKLVQSYINHQTPYRGLLLYHGLGSGKTCSSIAISEGIKEDMNVVVMSPASLESNFFQELKKCGDSAYSIHQHWEWNPVASGDV
jgi:hypothetical protein